MSIKIEGNIEEFNKAMNNLKNIDKKRLSQSVGEVLRESTLERFQNEEAPDGKKWKKSLRATGQNGSVGKTLAKSGALKSSLRIQATSSGVALGTNLIYASIHQTGGEIKAKSKRGLRFKIGDRFVRVNKVIIPARPYLGVSDEDSKEVTATVNNFMREIIK